MHPETFSHLIDKWIVALGKYDYEETLLKPDTNSWSIGQLYMHLIFDTKYYIEQINICTTTDENADQSSNEFAQSIFEANGFPDEKIAGAPDNDRIPQPLTKLQLIEELIAIKKEMTILAFIITGSKFKGKTKHPGLGYFSAEEWYQFAIFHFNHHLRQMNRIDNFLGKKTT